MSLTQDFLRSGGTLADLSTRFAIKAVRHRQHPNLVLLRYDQINSPFAEPIVRECRGMILDEASEWACVSRSFDKFFNHGEGLAAAIDWSTACVQEKVDGSLCSMYWYAGAWRVATTGTPDASGDINGSGRFFSDLFWSTMGRFDENDISDRWHGWTFLFELATPENRVVVRHAKPMLILLGARRAETGEWASAHAAADALAECSGLGDVPLPVCEFPLQSMVDIVTTFDTMNPLQQEGYVIVDADFNRIKVKHPGYVAIHHAKDGISPRALVEIARKGEASEVAAAFPEIAAEVESIKGKLVGLIANGQADYDRISHIAVQKDFAMEAVKTRTPALLFQMRKGVRPSDFYANAPIDHLMMALGMKPEKE